MLRHSKQWRKRPAFGLLVFAGVAEIDQLKLTLSSLQSQLYLHVRVLVLAPENELTDMREHCRSAPSGSVCTRCRACSELTRVLFLGSANTTGG
jgi:hypothetical protein